MPILWVLLFCVHVSVLFLSRPGLEVELRHQGFKPSRLGSADSQCWGGGGEVWFAALEVLQGFTRGA